MTELEKVKCGAYHAVDLNKLAEELREKNHAYIEECAKQAQSSTADFMKISIKTHMEVSQSVMMCLNAFLCKVGIKEPLLAHYAAALSVLRDVILNLSEDHKKHEIGAQLFTELLAGATKSVHIRVPDKRTGKEE